MNLKRTIESLRQVITFARYTLVITLLGGGGFFTAQAQNTVKGNVTDPSGAPLVGATVIIVEDNTKGTFTNADGDFEINVPQGNSLQISSIG